MAITPYTTSKSQLIEYIKRRLGEPVIQVELTPLQYEDAVNQAIEIYIEQGEGGVSMRYQQLAITSGTRLYTLDYGVYSVIKVFSEGSYSLDAIFPDRLIADQYGQSIQRSDLLTYEMTRSHLQTVEHMLSIQPIFDYNPVTREIYFMEIPSADATYGVVYYERSIPSSDDSVVYDQKIIRDLATEYARYQFGTNLSKYEGTTLPGGITQNASGILSEAKENIEKLEEELYTRYALPSDFFYG